MTISPVEVYFILQLDSIRDVAGMLLFILGVSSVLSSVIFFMSLDDCFGSDGTVSVIMKKFCMLSISLFFIFTIIRAFLPSTKRMAAVILLPQVINNEKVQQLPEDVLDLVQSLIKEWTTQGTGAKDGKGVGKL